jgi:Myb-like DNA-binding domain
MTGDERRASITSSIGSCGGLKHNDSGPSQSEQRHGLEEQIISIPIPDFGREMRGHEPAAIDGTGKSDQLNQSRLQLNLEESQTDSSDDEDEHHGLGSKTQRADVSPPSLPALPQKSIGRAASQFSRKRKAPLQYHGIHGPRKHSLKRFRKEWQATESDGDDASTRRHSNQVLPLSAVKVVRKQTDLNGSSKSYSTAQNTSSAITDITLHTVATSPEGFLTAVIRNTLDIFVVCRSEKLKTILANTLGDTHKLENISIKPLIPGMALLTASICNITHVSTSTRTRCPTMQANDATNKTERPPFMRERRPQNSIAAFSRHDDEISTDADSSSDSEEYSSEHTDREAKGAIKHGPKPLRPTKRLPWSLEEDESLRRWREEGKDWDWIFSQFPNRTPGAVRTRWYTKHQLKER